MARFARRQQGTGRTNCRLADVLSSAARARRGVVHDQQCDISGDFVAGVSGYCYNNGGLRNRRWANAITKHGGKGEWQTSIQTLPSRARGGLRFGAGAVLDTFVAGFR